MKKLLILLGIVLLLFGCVKITVEQKVNKDGTSTQSMIMDYAEVAKMGAAYGSSSSSSMGCDSDSGKSYKAQGWTCEQLNSTAIKLSGKPGDPEDYKFNTTSDFLGATYAFEMPLDLDDLGDTSAYGAQTAEGIAQLKAYGVEMWYVIEMPAPVTSAEGAVKIEGNKATFDMLDFMANGKTSVKVEAKETNLLIIGVVALVVLVVLAFVAMKVMKKK